MASATSQFGAEINGFSQQGNNSNSNSLLRLGSMSLPRQMSRQMSIYSLTLDEFQNALGEPGKNFGSMNMDELLKNIWTAEESQAMAAALFSNNTPNGTSDGNELVREPSIQRQNSLTLLPLPRELSNKTVDEVWRDISPVQDFTTSATQPVQPMKQRQGTYGEMTLEDFLIKAGVMAPDTLVPEQPNYYGNTTSANGVTVASANGYGAASTSRVPNLQQQTVANGIQPILGGMTGILPGKKEPLELNDPILGMGLGPSGLTTTNGYVTYNNAGSAASQAAKQQADWMESQYKNSTTLAQQQQQLMQLAAAGYMNGTNGTNGLGLGGAIVTKEGSPGSPLSDAPYGALSSGNGNLGGFEGPLRGRKRILDAPLEKIVERRQRRMIKNRESAARSRARKQAYTVELEAEVTQLKEENMRLKEENTKRKKQQALEVIGPMTRHLPKMLRRTVTGPW